MNTTHFHFGGFWFYVSWSKDGAVGTDQHGNRWFNKSNPHTADNAIEVLCNITHQTLSNQAKKQSAYAKSH